MSSSPTEQVSLRTRDSAHDEVKRLRWRLDAVNLELLRLLEHRARLALEVARLKQRRGLPVHDAQREREMLDALAAQSRGLLDAGDLEAVFNRIFQASRSLAQRWMSGA
jgi:3-deoxy-7-phosphoheptulonate synthase/chorismate mutase